MKQSVLQWPLNICTTWNGAAPTNSETPDQPRAGDRCLDHGNVVCELCLKHTASSSKRLASKFTGAGFLAAPHSGFRVPTVVTIIHCRL